MGWFKKKADPLADRARVLNAEIAALEAQIRELDTRLKEPPPPPPPAPAAPLPAAIPVVADPTPAPAAPPPANKAATPPPAAQPVPAPPRAAGPRVRSTTLPKGATPRPAPESMFEAVDHRALSAPDGGADTPEHFNDLGVRKYDLAALWRRVRNHFRGPSTGNPKLVNFLAAGSLEGLRPMRYETRVARSRLLLLALFLLLMLWGIYAMMPHR